MTEEEASKTEVADDLVGIGEIAEEAIKEEEASMAPEETLETDPEAASTVENKATWSKTAPNVTWYLVS